MIPIRRMHEDEFERIGEVDRTERVTEDYVYRDGSLELTDVDWNVPAWDPEAKGPHSLAGILRTWRPWLLDGGSMWGAFDGQRLVGFAIYRPRISEGTAQLAVLHVSHGHRGRGLGRRLMRRAVRQALRDGARELYVSSAPTKATVDFYRGLGFDLADPPDPELLALEPEDIHMTMPLPPPPENPLAG